jgi:peptidoglycan/LPS O-acetylase OafA/YrhL
MPRLSPTSAAGTSPSRPAGARYPNFDFIRLVAASSVIFSHAFQISEGTDENEPRADTIGCIFVLKPGRRDTGFIGKSKSSATNAWWSLRL